MGNNYSKEINKSLQEKIEQLEEKVLRHYELKKTLLSEEKKGGGGKKKTE